MRFSSRARQGDRVDGALLVYSLDRRGPHLLGLSWKIVLRLSLHYALAVRFVPADSDLRRHSWLARWVRLQFRLLWFPVDAPVISREEVEALPERQVLIARGLDPQRHWLVPACECDGWYVQRIPWWRAWRRA